MKKNRSISGSGLFEDVTGVCERSISPNLTQRHPEFPLKLGGLINRARVPDDDSTQDLKMTVAQMLRRGRNHDFSAADVVKSYRRIPIGDTSLMVSQAMTGRDNPGSRLANILSRTPAVKERRLPVQKNVARCTGPHRPHSDAAIAQTVKIRYACK